MIEKKLIFAGFGSLGKSSLVRLKNSGFKILYVLTHKDESEGSVDFYCQENGIQYSYKDLRKDSDLLLDLVNMDAEFLVSVNYRFVIPKHFLNSVKFPLNLHGSLLPKYRGRTPHVWAIINGEHVTGVTCHIMEETVDTGKIYEQIEIEILPSDTGASIINKFENIYPDCLSSALDKIFNNQQPLEQDENKASYFGKRIPDMGCIDFSKSKNSILDFIRALAKPYPGAYCFFPNGQKIIIHGARNSILVDWEKFSLGYIHKIQNEYFLRTRDGFLEITDYEILK